MTSPADRFAGRLSEPTDDGQLRVEVGGEGVLARVDHQSFQSHGAGIGVLSVDLERRVERCSL